MKCEECGKALGLGNYAALSGKYYCKPHFKQLFALKGNYSEGFGEEKPTAKWSSTPPRPPRPCTSCDSPTTWMTSHPSRLAPARPRPHGRGAVACCLRGACARRRQVRGSARGPVGHRRWRLAGSLGCSQALPGALDADAGPGGALARCYA